MDVGSEAVFVAGMAMHALLRSLGVHPDAMLGHSSGESSALAASGALPAGTPLELAAFVRQLNTVYERALADGKIATGALLAIGALRSRPWRTRSRRSDPGSSSRWTTVTTRSCSMAAGLDRRAAGQCLIAAGGICMLLPSTAVITPRLSPPPAPPSTRTTGASG